MHEAYCAPCPRSIYNDDSTEMVTRNPPRPSEDPGDMTGDDKHHPDTPTEPPNMPEGMRGRGSWEWVKTRVSRTLRGAKEGMGSDGDDERQPGMANEPSGRLYNEPQDYTDIQVDPGECTAHQSAGAVVDREVIGTHQDMQVEGESVTMC